MTTFSVVVRVRRIVGEDLEQTPAEEVLPAGSGLAERSNGALEVDVAVELDGSITGVLACDSLRLGGEAKYDRLRPL